MVERRALIPTYPKFNMGCGQNHLPEFVNVDKFMDNPDFITKEEWDLEVEAWPWKEGSATYILFNHSLEHMGSTPERFCWIMQEIYRLGASGCVVQINVPHPRHDDFLNDPTHIRPITPDLLSLFSRANCRKWKAEGAANSPLAFYYHVDFEITTCSAVADPRLQEIVKKLWRDGIDASEMMHLAMYVCNNVIKEYQITLKVIK